MDELVYRVYNLPGGFALLLTAIGLIGMLDGPADKAARLLGIIAASLGVVSVLGATVGFDPLFTGPRIFGTLALGVATVLAGWRLPAGSRAGRWRRWLIALGGLGIFLLPVWPLVYAVEIIPEWLGAVMIGGFGLGWVLTDVQQNRSPV